MRANAELPLSRRHVPAAASAVAGQFRARKDAEEELHFMKRAYLNLKKCRAIFLLTICGILCGLLLIFFQSTAEAKKIMLSTGEWAPYSSRKMPGHGFISEIITEILKI